MIARLLTQDLTLIQTMEVRGSPDVIEMATAPDLASWNRDDSDTPVVIRKRVFRKISESRTTANYLLDPEYGGEK